MTAKQPHIVVIGGGISGLSAAWFLQKMGVHYSLLEASDRWGGKVLTEQVNEFTDTPFVIEAGPDSFLTQKPWALQLARDLGLSDQLVSINNRGRNTYMLHRGKPIALPDGFQLIIPTKLMPFLRSPLLSLPGKLRMALDWLILARPGDDDETLAGFIRRRFGDEALDKIAEPLLSGIYNAESDKQSLLATFPRFRQLEREHGSLIRGTLKTRQAASASAPKTPTPPFMTLKGGTQELIESLVNQLTGDLQLQTRVTAIESLPDQRYRVTTDSGETLEADAILVTTPAYVTAQLLRPLKPKVADQLATIRHVSTGTISLAFKAADITLPLQGFGLVIPKSEQRPINAVTISSLKFDHRAPDGYILMRVFFGGSRSPQTMRLDDEHLLQVIRQELRSILNIDAEPLFHRIYRWYEANPQYDVNHLKLVNQIETGLPAGMYVTGCAFRGVGMPDCVYQAQQTVAKLLQHLKPVQPELLELTEAIH
ncbi:MAG TPA: protoporphyrinogen oxidase [Phototrophicaceae bacterium]|jgi:oxygen-dependent protoporphyrinogen oxidase|nr:protoporphyrinogen oxidase [Phototrophicaceae bacterium]